jgi:hypothetical protein
MPEIVNGTGAVWNEHHIVPERQQTGRADAKRRALANDANVAQEPVVEVGHRLALPPPLDAPAQLLPRSPEPSAAVRALPKEVPPLPPV